MLYCLGFLPVSTVITLYNTGPIFIHFIEFFHYKVNPSIFSARIQYTKLDTHFVELYRSCSLGSTLILIWGHLD